MKTSAVRKALENSRKEKKYTEYMYMAYRRLGKNNNNNIYTVCLNFIQRQRQMCVLFSIFQTYKSTLNTLTDGAECKVNVFYWQTNEISTERVREREKEWKRIVFIECIQYFISLRGIRCFDIYKQT